MDLKKCKGFDNFICWCCKRCDWDSDKTLVEKLSFDLNTDKPYCNYHVSLHK